MRRIPFIIITCSLTLATLYSAYNIEKQKADFTKATESGYLAKYIEFIEMQ